MAEASKQNEAEEHAKAAAEEAREAASAAREAAGESARKSLEDLRAQLRDVEKQVRVYVDEGERHIAERPYASVGTAFLAGLVIGALLRR